MKFSLSRNLVLCLLSGFITPAYCGQENEALLKVHIDGVSPNTPVITAYSPTGDARSNIYEQMSLDSTGSFSFSPQLPAEVEFTEIEINIGGISYGAYVSKGSTTSMDLSISNPHEYGVVTFNGDNVDINKAVNAATQAYDFMRYFSLDPGETKAHEEYSAMLECENERVGKALEGIADRSKKDYYSRLFAMRYLGQKISNYSNKLYDEGVVSMKSAMADPEFKKMYDAIDINDPLTGKANLVGAWLNVAKPYEMDWEHPDVDSMIVNLRYIDKNVTEPFNRRVAFASAPFMYLEKVKPSKADARKYMQEYAALASAYPDVVAHYEKLVEEMVELGKGDAMPCYPVLTDAAGNEANLSDLMGKVTYIDLWATWCRPCCQEIPYFDKVVEHYKDNDKIQFLSISIDDDRDAWLRKINKDNPSWPQYLLSGDERTQFLNTLGIKGIPRFILLDAEGRFIQSDAVRPSSDNIHEILSDAIAGKPN